jgi:hypothetical protein
MSEHTQRTSEGAGETSETAVARAGVVRALGDLECGTRDALEALHVALCRLVAVLRRTGRSCEEIVADIRDIAMQPVTPDGANKIPRLAREALADLTTRWCEDEYGRA